MDKKVLYGNAVEIARIINSTCKTIDDVEYLFRLINTFVVLDQFVAYLEQPQLVLGRTA